MRAAIGIAGVIAAACGGGGWRPDATPAITVGGPALAIVHDDPDDNPDGAVLVAIDGAIGAAAAGSFAPADCGTPAGGAFVVARDAGDAVIAVAGSTAAGTTWTPARTVGALPAGATPATRVDWGTPLGAPHLRRGLWGYRH